MVSFPSFPKGSLYTGHFPSFPTTTYSWGFNFFGTWEGFSIQIPNFLDIPKWIASLAGYAILYALGWIGAVFEFVIQYAEAEATTISEEVLNEGTKIFNGTVSLIEQITGHSGIFAPILATIFMGILIIGIMLAVFLLARLISEAI